MVNPNKIHNKDLWDNFVKELGQNLAILSPGTRVAFYIGELAENFLYIERKEGAIDSKFVLNGSLGFDDADLILTLAEDDAFEILDNPKLLCDYVKEMKVGIICLVDDDAIVEKGINTFLNDLGFPYA